MKQFEVNIKCPTTLDEKFFSIRMNEVKTSNGLWRIIYEDSDKKRYFVTGFVTHDGEPGSQCIAFPYDEFDNIIVEEELIGTVTEI